MAKRVFSDRATIYTTIAVSVAMGILLSLLLDNLHILGRHIPTSEIGADYFKGVITSLVLMPLFSFSSRNSVVFNLMALWSIRCLVTLGFMLYYEYSYGLDAYNYFKHAISHVSITEGFALFDGTGNVVVIARFLAQNIAFLDSYHALKVFWSFLGLTGCYLFYRAYERNSGDKNLAILWVICLFPSVLFWSSILGKDPIVFLGIGLFFYGSTGLFKKFNYNDMALAMSGLVVTGTIRIWLVVLFALSFLLLYLFRSRTHILGKGLITAGAAALIFYFSSSIISALQIKDAVSLLDTLNRVASSWTHGGSGQSIQHFASSREALLFLPKGIFTALFRPLPGEINNLFGILSGVENFLLLAFLSFALLAADKKYLKDSFIQYALLTIFIWSLFYAFISYQNLGTAVRFKLQVLPILLLVPARLMHYINKKEGA